MKLRAGIAAAIVVMAVSAGSLLSSVDAAYAGSCRPDNRPKSDPWGYSWSTGWICGNRSGARVYWGSDFVVPVATLLSNPSWFVCWEPGAWHAGQNNVWYYTKGDRVLPGKEWSQRWGFVPAVNVMTSIDPWPGIPRCYA